MLESVCCSTATAPHSQRNKSRARIPRTWTRSLLVKSMAPTFSVWWLKLLHDILHVCCNIRVCVRMYACTAVFVYMCISVLVACAPTLNAGEHMALSALRHCGVVFVFVSFIIIFLFIRCWFCFCTKCCPQSTQLRQSECNLPNAKYRPYYTRNELMFVCTICMCVFSC